MRQWQFHVAHLWGISSKRVSKGRLIYSEEPLKSTPPSPLLPATVYSCQGLQLLELRWKPDNWVECFQTHGCLVGEQPPTENKGKCACLVLENNHSQVFLLSSVSLAALFEQCLVTRHAACAGHESQIYRRSPGIRPSWAAERRSNGVDRQPAGRPPHRKNTCFPFSPVVSQSKSGLHHPGGSVSHRCSAV